MHIDYLGFNSLYGQNINGAFLFGYLPVEKLQGKTIVIWGTGNYGVQCFGYLRDKGLDVSFFTCNRSREPGGLLLGKKILRPPDVFSLENRYIIAATDEVHHVFLVSQLIKMNGKEFSLFFVRRLPVFGRTSNLWNILMPTINILIKNILKWRIPRYYESYKTTEVVPLAMVTDLLANISTSDMVLEAFVGKKYKKIDTLLDIGPGVGMTSLLLSTLYPNISLTWIDFAKEYSVTEVSIDSTDHKIPVTKINGLVESPLFKIEGKFDVIVFTEVLEHFPFNPLPTFKKIANALKDEGYIIFSTPHSIGDPTYSYNSYKDLPEFTSYNDYTWTGGAEKQKYMAPSHIHCYIYNYEELCEIFEYCDLEIVNYFKNDYNQQILLRRKKA